MNNINIHFTNVYIHKVSIIIHLIKTIGHLTSFVLVRARPQGTCMHISVTLRVWILKQKTGESFQIHGQWRPPSL